MKSKIAIVGTAGTWRDTPWDDPDMDIVSLNDAYMLGFKKIDGWYDQHPLDHFVFRKKEQQVVTPMQIPPGHYLRPEGHVEWLKEQSFKVPVWLQNEPPKGWGPHAKRYPMEEMIEKFKDFCFVDPTWAKPYAASGPIWMLMQAIDQGYQEIHIYGIHLATEREYIEQKPNFEALCAYAIGKGIKIVLPPKCPLFKSSYVYCYERRLSQDKDRVKYELSEIDHQRKLVTQEMMHRPWYRRKFPLQDKLADLEASRACLMQDLEGLTLAEAQQSPEWRVT